jgi:hypothetical protein
MTSGDPQGGAPESGRARPESVLTDKHLTRSPFVQKVHTNVSSDVIQITEDKALICLMKNFKELRERDAWQVPAGILATLLTVMVTTAPTEKLGLSKDTWTAIGLLATFLTGLWLIRDLYRRFTGKHVTPESIVIQLKTSTGTMS